MNLHVTGGAIGVLRILIMLRTSRLARADVMRQAVAREAKLIHGAESKQTRIRGTVRRVAGRAAFRLHWSVFVSKRPLLVHMALETWRVPTRCQSHLFEFKTTVWIMTVAAFYRAFENFVMEGLVKVGLRFSMAAHANLRVTCFQHVKRCETRLLGIGGTHKDIRARSVLRDCIG